MKKRLALCCIAMVTLTASADAEEDGRYLEGGLWEVSVSMVGIEGPHFDEAEKEDLLAEAERLATTQTECKAAKNSSERPQVGDIFHLSRGSSCRYSKVEDDGQNAHREAVCISPPDVAITVRGTIAPSQYDLEITLTDMTSAGTVVVTRESGRLVGSCSTTGTNS